MSDKIDIVIEFVRDTRQDVKEILAQVASLSARTASLEEQTAGLSTRVSSLEEPTKALRGARRIGAWIVGILLSVSGVWAFFEKVAEKLKG